MTTGTTAPDTGKSTTSSATDDSEALAYTPIHDLSDRGGAVSQVIDTYGLTPHLKARFDELSGGWARRVRSGDAENLEAQASAIYFRALFGANFDRSQGVWTNAALDYGYSIFRGAIARGLVAHGFMPSIGLFHRSEQNAFNLADDVIEPFRPIVDLHVTKMRPLDDSTPLSPTHKADLIALLNIDVRTPRGIMAALSAIEHSVESLARIYEPAHAPKLAHAPARRLSRKLAPVAKRSSTDNVESGNAPQLEWPELIGLTAHRREM